MCAAALGIHRKNIYHPVKQPAKDQALKQQIETIHREHPAYGHRRVALYLGINHKRAQRVMAHPALQHCFHPASHLSQSTPGHDCPLYPSGLVQ